MSGHITPPQFDPHAEAIDGPPKDLWPVDNRVKAARRADWLIGDDPAPEYSALDARDGLTPYTADVVLPRPVPARPEVDFGPVLQDPHGYYSIGMVAGVLGFGIVCFILGGLAVYAMHLMVVAS